jgi:hypothetical protein
MKKTGFLLLLALVLNFTSCKKEITYAYEINDVEVKNQSSNKNRLKSTTEFISIAYLDLFGTSITNQNLNLLSLVYLSFGDKKLLEDLLIRNMLNAPAIQIPSAEVMRSNVGQFVEMCYQKFYNREPDALEKQFLVNYIENNQQITPELIYYSFMTSNEYRYY